MTRQSKTRQTRSLGGCKTCKRRHVKCEQSRPVCQTCSTRGLVCEGFSEEVHWMPEKKLRGSQTSSNDKRGYLTSLGIRRHLYTEQYRRSMGSIISKGLVSGSIDASLEEIDLRSQDPSFFSKDETQVGPFAVLNFTNASSFSGEEANNVVADSIESDYAPAADHGNPEFGLSSYPAVDIPGCADDLLQWSDLFSMSDDFHGTLSGSPLGLGSSLDFSQLDCPITAMGSAFEDTSHPPPYLAQTLSPINIMGDASFLLKNFQKNIVPQMTVVPLAKSPWNILNVPTALITLGELTIMESEDVSHARQANLYSLLACSAVYLAMTSSAGTLGSCPRDHWIAVAEQAYQDARSHINISLVDESGGSKKAKLKDQLMAIYGLTEYAIFSGNYLDARKYLIDAERLLRFRGLAKRKISQKLRLLFNIYAWLRLVGESTYVLHSYVPSDSFIDSLNTNCQVQTPPAGERSTAEIHSRCRRIDDFLYFENSEGDLNIDKPKDRRLDIPDIHLQDSRISVESLCQQVYGIPETMLSLVSQTTRLANVIETLRNAQNSLFQISDHVLRTLERRSTRLENVVNTFRNRELAASLGEDQASPYKLMVQALNSALVIFFYRRVRQVHPAILGGHVDHVIATLEAWLSLIKDGSPVGPGTLWPIFIAGCEATTISQRDAILYIVDQAGTKSGLQPFRTAKDIMSEVWRRQDEQQAANLGDPLPTWMDVLKMQKLWPMFC